MSATPRTDVRTDFETDSDDAMELAEELAAAVGVQELRSWMSEAGLTRSRGARKLESAVQAVEQDPEAVREKLDGLRAGFEATCHCGLHEEHGSADEAEEAARAHKSEHNTHFPRAVAADGERIYG